MELFVKRSRVQHRVLTSSYIRPANGDQYALGDVIADSVSAATILTFTNAAPRPGEGGVIIGAMIIDSFAETLKPDIELFLLNATITMQQDNAAWTPSDADMEKVVGVLRFNNGLWVSGNGNGLLDLQGCVVPYACAANSTSLYGIAVARNTYSPGSGEKFTFKLFVEQSA